mmetsp:Transcript_19520/g.40436  ORF Transcript_19520/g.40436 Transcript_19520/m.40436 type:complete len:276 (+) Transcript_19520:597-1424(+)
MHTECEIGRQGPRCGGPGHKGSILFSLDRKGHDNGRIVDILVIETCFKVGKRSGTRSRIWHDLVPLVDQPLVKQLSKDPPNRFHKTGIHGFVVIFEINPTSQSSNGGFPFGRVASHNGSTSFVVLINAHFQHLIAVGNVELLINFIFHGQTVTIPSGTTLHVLSVHGRISSHGIFNGTGQNVTVMRQTRGKGWTIVKGVFLISTIETEFVLHMECFLLAPFLHHFFFHFWKIQCRRKRRHDDAVRFSSFSNSTFVDAATAFLAMVTLLLTVSLYE